MAELEYKLIDKSVTGPVCKLLLESFFKDEPLGLALDLTTSQVSRWLPDYLEAILKEPVSLGAFSEDVLVGICINVVESHPSLISCINREDEPAMFEVARFLQNLNAGLSLETELSLEPDAKILTTLFLNVSSSFGGKGIATKLALKAEDLARDLGVAAIQVDTTSEFSYRVYAKLGYRVLRQLEYSEFRTEDSNEQVISDSKIGPIHSCGRALGKLIMTGDAESCNSKE